MTAQQTSAAVEGVDRLIADSLRVVVVGLVAFGLWAAFAPLSQGVVAEGVIVVDGRRKAVQHLEGGIVQAIHVREGDLVEGGQIVVELDQTQALAQRDLLQVRYLAGLALLARLEAEWSGAQDLAPSEALLEAGQEDAREMVAMQRELFAVRAERLAGEIEILTQRVDALGSQIVGLEAERTAHQQELAIISEELERTRDLHERNLVEAPRVWEQERAQAAAQGAIGRADADISGARIEIGEARLEMLQLTRVNREDVAEAMLDARESVYQIREQLASIEDVIARTQVRAPQEGRVLNLQVVTVGGVVQPGGVLMEIVPDQDRLVAEIRVRPADIDGVQPDMPVRVRILTSQGRKLPAVTGRVEDVSADLVTAAEGQDPYFLARIDIPQPGGPNALDAGVAPGVPVEVLVEGGQGTALSYLSEPIRRVMRRAMREG